MKQSATGKRYAELPGVTLRLEKIPRPLVPLLEDAKKWAIVGETGIEKAILKTRLEEMEGILSAALPLRDQIRNFAFESEGASQTPVPDEVVLFQMFSCVLQRIESTVLLRKSRTRRWTE